jgi:RNA polymerase sigma factor (TIGR02999 family)
MRQPREIPDTAPNPEARSVPDGNPGATELTELLARLRGGNRAALDQAVARVYDELRQVAARQLRRERDGHTLYPTALVHEAYLKLSGAPGVPAVDRAHFVAIAARAMRQILVDYARQRGAGKRGGDFVRTTLDDKDLADTPAFDADLIALDAALDRLGALDERARTVVEHRFFIGLTEEETADLLHLSVRTVRREWVKARAWLHAELAAHEGTHP